jgi:hypothetical protein
MGPPTAARPGSPRGRRSEACTPAHCGEMTGVRVILGSSAVRMVGPTRREAGHAPAAHARGPLRHETPVAEHLARRPRLRLIWVATRKRPASSSSGRDRGPHGTAGQLAAGRKEAMQGAQPPLRAVLLESSQARAAHLTSASSRLRRPTAGSSASGPRAHCAALAGTAARPGRPRGGPHGRVPPAGLAGSRHRPPRAGSARTRRRGARCSVSQQREAAMEGRAAGGQLVFRRHASR